MQTVERGPQEQSSAGYEGLVAWQVADDLAVDIYQATKPLLRDDRWLRNQILRSSESAPANIAEGYGCLSKKEFVQFLAIAQRSLFETRYHLHFIKRTGLLDATNVEDLTVRCQRASRLVYGLMRSSKVTTAADSRRQRYLKAVTNDDGR